MAALPVVSSKRHPLIAAYLANLQTHPIRTKAATAAVLQFAQDVVSSRLAGVPAPQPAKDAPPATQALALVGADEVALKMAVYGAIVQAPLNHFLSGWLARYFAGRTGARAKIGMLLGSNLLVAPINVAALLISVAIINGARTTDQVLRAVRGGFFRMLQMTWLISPAALFVAQRFFSPELWSLWFSFVGFVAGTLGAAKVKRARLEAARKKAFDGKGAAA